jgi:hypothetical protein
MTDVILSNNDYGMNMYIEHGSLNATYLQITYHTGPESAFQFVNTSLIVNGFVIDSNQGYGEFTNTVAKISASEFLNSSLESCQSEFFTVFVLRQSRKHVFSMRYRRNEKHLEMILL